MKIVPQSQLVNIYHAFVESHLRYANVIWGSLFNTKLEAQRLQNRAHLFGILRIPPFVNHKGKDVNSDWHAGQWDERSVLGHARINKGRMKGDDPEIDTAQTPKRFDGNLTLQEKIRKTFADSIPNNHSIIERAKINIHLRS